MKYIIPYIYTSLVFILFLISTKSNAQDAIGLAKELDKYIYPITIKSASDSTKNSLPINLFRDKSIIALGESTHGTKEFNLFKSQVIKEQILSNNVKIIALEADFGYSILLNNYLISDETDTLKLEYQIYGIYKTQEIYDLLIWIKSYNLKQPMDKRVNVLGIDMQDPYTIANNIIKDFPQLRSSDITTFDKLEKLKQLFFVKNDNYDKLESADYEQLILKLKSDIKSNKSIGDTILFSHYVNLLKQSLALRVRTGFFTNVKNNPANLRDKFMAENVAWLYRRYANNGKLILLAHNEHISHTKLRGSYRMGYHLKETFGNKYYALGFLFDEGSVRIYDLGKTKRYKSFLYSSSIRENSTEFVLKNCRTENFFLPIDENLENPLFISFCNKYRFTREIGARYQPDPRKDYYKTPIGKCFDGIVFFKKAYAAEDITKKK